MADTSTDQREENRRSILQLYSNSVFQNAGFAIAIAIGFLTEFQLLCNLPSYFPRFILVSFILGTATAIVLILDTLAYWYNAIEAVLKTPLESIDTPKTTADSLVILDAEYGRRTMEKLRKSWFTRITAFRAVYPWQVRASNLGLLVIIASLPVTGYITGYFTESNLLSLTFGLCLFAAGAAIGLEIYVLWRACKDKQ